MLPTQTTHSKVIVALDYADAVSALAMVNQLDPSLCRLKVGKELFTASGPQFIDQLIAKKYDVFLDLKFHDIPNTVAKACEAAAKLGVWMLNVHASGGLDMMLAAKRGVNQSGHQPLLIAVTVLTSANQHMLESIGVTCSLEQQVLRLASLTQLAGLDGVVCSALELKILREYLPREFCLVTPGIRLENVNHDDQNRVVSPRNAIQMGSDYLVIGRPITQAANPIKVLMEINQDLANFGIV